MRRDSAAETILRESPYHSAEITHRLPAFSRRSPLQPKALDFASFIPGLIKLLERTLGERITISAHVEQNRPEVCVDHAQLEAALINLAVNARDAMPDGGMLDIAVQRRDAPAPGCVEGACSGEIAVAGSGTGMPPAILARVLEPFFTTKEAGKGTGLGLSMVYGFVQQSAGTIAVDSDPGQGTRFVITLPALVRPSSLSTEIETGTLAGGPNSVDGAGKTVLVVEDDAEVRSTVVSTPEALAFRAISAPNGSEALRLLQSEANIALVFSDVNMPGSTNGIDLGHAIRQRWPHMPILLTSGYLHEDQDTTSFDLLQKPYRTSDLIEML